MNMRTRFLREVAAAGLSAQTQAEEAVSAADIAALPDAAQRYLRFMGVPGRARDWSFRLGFAGRFRTKPEQRWMRCQAWQYDHRPALARIFQIRVLLGGMLPLVARDTYIDGHGRLLVKLFDRFTVADGKGDEYDIGELVTYLNDAVLGAPSMLLTPAVAWSAVDHASFNLTLTHEGKSVSARVTIDANGAPTDFSTADRFYTDPDHPRQPIRMRWNTPVAGWQSVDGRQVPRAVQAVWQLPQGPFVYADLRLRADTLAYNVAPGE